jgi:hypothetical protein
VLVSFDVGRVDHDGFIVGPSSKELENPLENLELVPTRELHVDGLPGTEALGKIAPGCARLGDVKDRVHERAIGQLGGSATATALSRQQGFDQRPIFVAQLMPSHLQT